MNTLDENWELFCSKLEKVKPTSNGIEALCPTHEDKKPSLTAKHKDGKIFFTCHAGCSNEKILQVIGMEWHQFFAPSNNSNTPKKEEVARYRYEDQDSNPLYDVVKFKPIQFY